MHRRILVRIWFRFKVTAGLRCLFGYWRCWICLWSDSPPKNVNCNHSLTFKPVWLSSVKQKNNVSVFCFVCIWKVVESVCCFGPTDFNSSSENHLLCLTEEKKSYRVSKWCQNFGWNFPLRIWKNVGYLCDVLQDAGGNGLYKSDIKSAMSSFINHWCQV